MFYNNSKLHSISVTMHDSSFILHITFKKMIFPTKKKKALFQLFSFLNIKILNKYKHFSKKKRKRKNCAPAIAKFNTFKKKKKMNSALSRDTVQVHATLLLYFTHLNRTSKSILYNYDNTSNFKIPRKKNKQTNKRRRQTVSPDVCERFCDVVVAIDWASSLDAQRWWWLSAPRLPVNWGFPIVGRSSRS